MKGFAKDENAVSPIVATLVLIVVAVVGAVSVGTIMGTFSDDVTKQTNTGDISSATATEILIAGSTTVQPVSELLAEAYMKENPGVKITVQGGGSGAGVSAAGMGIADVGAASRDLKDSEATKYPELQTKKIGGSAVVVIVNDASTLTEISKADLAAIYDGTSAMPAGVSTAYVRAEESGTQDTFVEYVLGKGASVNSSATGAVGNAGVLAAVQDNPSSIGFVDAGYGLDATGITVLNINDGKVYTTNSDNIKKALGGSDTYPAGLTRPLNYIIGSSPSSIVNDFIQFAQSPGAIQYFDEAGMYSVMSI
ncbi:MAG: extracellular solute-binding protein [Methanomicrobiaceae archaeon]|nr:extracellular solute-binding protein [Methanomicrobiaceae archaeon]